ncbi:MAG: hypothetical protein HY704_04110 [Gemmatimonadetes bacterium]|nr:hypothetical protein [Gemmatimonadota bacterium]
MNVAKASRRLRVAGLVIAEILSACGDEGPVPGVLTVSLSSANMGDGAIAVVVSGPGPVGSVESASPSVLLFSRLTAPSSFNAAAFGDLRSGPLLRFGVPDVGQVGGYTARVLEVADVTGALRGSAAGYALAVSR